MQIDVGSFYRCRNGTEVEIFDMSSTFVFGVYVDGNGKRQGSYWYEDTGQYGPAERKQKHEMDLIEFVGGDVE